MMGVHTTRGVFAIATFRSKDATGTNHFDVTIPFDTQLKFEILNSNLQLTQASGAAVNASISVQQSSAAPSAAPPLVFQVTGIAP
jgi:hypothetical protein